ncbi:MAG: hypothetical protein KTR31_15485 [Myxococcales bacterium]|nr:hypothetical protein [Myxococcales bacterium]
MRQVIGAALVLLTAAPAYAGGIGIMGMGGAHNEQVYYYSQRGPDGDLYNNIDDFDQYELDQVLPHFGGGLELVLGDRDDKVMGSIRVLYNLDAPVRDPATVTTEVEPDDVVANVRDEPRHLGFALVGLSWGLVGDPGGFQLTAVGHVGTAFITADHTEFLAVQIGPGFTYRMARQMQLFGDVQYQGRFRKQWSNSVQAHAGIRYLFD